MILEYIFLIYCNLLNALILLLAKSVEMPYIQMCTLVFLSSNRRITPDVPVSNY